MRPAEGERHGVPCDQRLVAAVAVDLQCSGEPGQVGDRSLGLSIGGIDEGDLRRVGAAPGAVIARIGPELAGLGPSATGIEYPHRGLVDEQLG